MQHVSAALLLTFNLLHKGPFHLVLQTCVFCLNLSIVLRDFLLALYYNLIKKLQKFCK